MKSHFKYALISAALIFPVLGKAQVGSPKVLLAGQLDTTDLKGLTQTLYSNAHAVTEREKAEAIWRFLLTDGRFVKPGIFYHIPGWSYEEPMGEVLDPVKLLNSYGFGLCYQDGPLLQALWEAGGFAHTRVWFLTGHTVAEVFYDGQYHYYDSDMMGYTTVGNASFKTAPVASVAQLANDPTIIKDKLQGPRVVKAGTVDYPWYPADVRADAMDGLSDLFTTTKDNYLYSFTRYPHGHTMDFTLRPGERIIRYYRQPDNAIRYMPYATDGNQWREFPKDVGSILQIKNGPRSEKDQRRWSTGLIEYKPTDAAIQKSETTPGTAVIAMPSSYVIFGATFSAQVSLAEGESLLAETSIDDGHTWTYADEAKGPYHAVWKFAPATLAKTEHGSKSAVAGTYGYLVRLKRAGSNASSLSGLHDVQLTTFFEFNPRSLPELTPGTNKLSYTSTTMQRHELPVHAADAQLFASVFHHANYVSEAGQGFLQNDASNQAEIIFPLSAAEHGDLAGFDAGGRFLDLQNGLAPDKLTAEVRKVAAWPADPNAPKSASISWSLHPGGPWTPLWSYNPKVAWPDQQTQKQMLRWPEVDRQVRTLPPSTHTIYVRYLFKNMAFDDVRLATVEKVKAVSTSVTVTHLWSVDGKQNKFTEAIDGDQTKNYSVTIPDGVNIENEALILSAQ